MSTELVLEQKKEDIVGRASALEILDSVTYERAVEYAKAIKAIGKDIELFCEDGIKAAHATWKTLLAARDEKLKPLREAEAILKAKMVRYTEEEERKRRAEEARIREEMRKQAEEFRLREAEQLEKEGRMEEASRVIEEPIVAPTVVLPQSPQPKGVSYRETYSARVTDIKALCQAVVEGRVPEAAITPNMTVLNQQARSLKTALKWPGVEVVCERTAALR